MPSIHPESPENRPATTEISAMNREFLALLTHPLVAGQPRLLGLDTGVLAGLRRLSTQQLDRLAEAPLLLADFALLPGARPGNSQPACQVEENSAPAEWLEALSSFSNRLLTSLWHYSRQADPVSGFCFGLGSAAVDALAAMSFADLSACAPAVCASMHVRHADHPLCWADLVSGARCAHPEKLTAAQLSLIPLTVADNFSGRS